jgi:predicted permease
MFLVGLSMANSRLKDLFSDWKLYILAALRLIIIPFVLIAVFRLVPFKSTSLVPKVYAILSAMPVAAVLPAIAEQYNANIELASKTVFITSLLSMLTIPLVLLFV